MSDVYAALDPVNSPINDPLLEPAERLEALKRYARERKGPSGGGEVNNHIHTVYSFSPYTPAMAALMAYCAGLTAAGSVDHDSAAAADELKAAAAELGIGGCSGFEARVSFKDRRGGFFARRKINNPDSEGIAYVTVQGIPRSALEKTAAFLKPIREARLRRSRTMTAAANDLLREAKLPAVDFENDIAGRSQYYRGGEITERHLMAAAASKLTGAWGRKGMLEGLRKNFGIVPGLKQEKLLSDPENQHYLYDLLGVLKTGFLPRFFIQPDENECPPADKVVDFALSVQAIPAYSYLGDVGESPTGDKKAEKFEDDYLDDLFEEITASGFKAVTYMPPRNTPAQLERIRRFCSGGNYMEISGVDINSSRQSFNCPEVLLPSCRHLVDTTWALIAHEYLADAAPRLGIFSPDNPLGSLPLAGRLDVYARAGKALDLGKPEESALKIAEALLGGKLDFSR
jgi:hypothetical protein